MSNSSPKPSRLISLSQQNGRGATKGAQRPFWVEKKLSSHPNHPPLTTVAVPRFPFGGCKVVCCCSSFRPGFRSRPVPPRQHPHPLAGAIRYLGSQTKRYSIASRASLSNNPGCCEARRHNPSPASTRASICETRKPRHNSSLTTSHNRLPHPTPIAARSRATGIRLGLAHEQLSLLVPGGKERRKHSRVLPTPVCSSITNNPALPCAPRRATPPPS
jgi:hypothetical protein